jgi:hypothetical protein
MMTNNLEFYQVASINGCPDFQNRLGKTYLHELNTFDRTLCITGFECVKAKYLQNLDRTSDLDRDLSQNVFHRFLNGIKYIEAKSNFTRTFFFPEEIDLLLPMLEYISSENLIANRNERHAFRSFLYIFLDYLRIMKRTSHKNCLLLCASGTFLYPQCCGSQ